MFKVIDDVVRGDCTRDQINVGFRYECLCYHQDPDLSRSERRAACNEPHLVGLSLGICSEDLLVDNDRVV